MMQAALRSERLDQPVIQPQPVIQVTHLMIVQETDPLGKFTDAHGEHLLQQDSAFLALDLGLGAGKTCPG